MIVKMNLDGVIEKTYGSRVFRGSNAVTEIALFAPFDPQSTVIINFTLPDGTEIPGIMTFADFSVEDHYNMWVYKLRQNVTSMEGRVTLSFEVRAYVDETEVTTTAETHIYIEKSSSTTFLDEVDEFFALANEALTRSQQALNLNQATNEALEIEIERNNEQDNAIEAINQTLTSQQNVINEHGSKLEILSELPSRMNRAEQNIGILNNQVNALPNPQDILTKQNYTMPEGYAPTQPHHLADKKYVDDVVEAMSGTNPEHFVTHAQLNEALYKPDFIDLTIDEPVYHITEATLDSPKEIQVIEGSTIEVDGQLVPVKNPVIESVDGRNLFDWEHILRNNPSVSRTTYDGRDCLSWIAGSDTMNQRFLQGRFKPNTQYTISGYFAVERGYAYLKIFYTDGSLDDMRITSTTFTCHTFTTRQGKTVAYLRGSWDSGQSVYLDINTTMLNEGTTPLPYEPFRSTKLAINGEYHQWDKIINDGGVYYDEIGSGKVTFDGSEDWMIQSTNNPNVISVYVSTSTMPNSLSVRDRLKADGIFTVGPVGTSNESNINTINYSSSGMYLIVDVSKDIADTLEDWKQYLSQNPLTVVYQLATPTRKPTSITKAGDPDFSQGSTIYLHSDTEAIPTVHAKVAMDIAGQVNQLTKDSSNKSKKLHDHGQRIKANEIAIVDLEQAINDLNTEVSDINQTIDQVEGRIEQLEEALHDVEETVGQLDEEIYHTQNDLQEAQNELNQLQTDVSNSITAIQNELDKKITLDTSYSQFTRNYEIGTILPVYYTDSIHVGDYEAIKVRYYNNRPIGFERTSPGNANKLNGEWICIGQCGENYYLFQRVS